MNKFTSPTNKSSTSIGEKNIIEKEKYDFNLKLSIVKRSVKKCSKCGIEQSLNEFYFKAGKRRLQAECRTCLNGSRMKKHSSSPAEYIDYLTKNLRNNSSHKKRKESKLQRHEFLEIFKKQFERFGVLCPYSGLKMTWELGTGRPIETNISIDRFDSTRPYERGNIIFCCWFVNRMKYDYTDLEFIGACEHIANNKDRFKEVREFLRKEPNGKNEK